MAAYPDVCQHPSSRIKRTSGTKVSRSTNGHVRATSAYDVDSYDMTVVHGLLSDIDKQVILDHYDANRNGEFSFLFNLTGLTYTVIYSKPPNEVWIAPNVWNVAVFLAGR